MPEKRKGSLTPRYGKVLGEETAIVSHFEFIWHFLRFYCSLPFHFTNFKIIEIKTVRLESSSHESERKNMY